MPTSDLADLQRRAANIRSQLDARWFHPGDRPHRFDAGKREELRQLLKRIERAVP
jgi:hypothetical protein